MKHRKSKAALIKVVEKAELYSKQVKKYLRSKESPYLDDLYKEKIISNGTRTERLEGEFIKRKWLPNNLDGHKEFTGIYVFGLKEGLKVTPIYVGISRSVYRRLRQHGWGKKHTQATLAYNMAKDESGHEGERDDLCEDIYEKKRVLVRNLKVCLIPITDDYTLYLTEVLLAELLQTKWNSFKTH